MRYFFDIAISINDSHGSKHYDWWKRFKDWRNRRVAGDETYAAKLAEFALVLFLDEGMMAITSPLECGVERDVLDAVIALVQRYLREVPSALPVGFTYAGCVRENGTDLVEPYRRYDGGAVFITKHKIYEEAAFDRLVAIQERVAKMGDAVASEDDEQAGSIHPVVALVPTHDAIVEEVVVLMSLEDALKSCQAYAAQHPGGFDHHSYVASAMFGYTYADFVNRKDTILVPDEKYRTRLELLRRYVKTRMFSHLYGMSSPKSEKV
jgi:hypothetical protein